MARDRFTLSEEECRNFIEAFYPKDYIKPKQSKQQNPKEPEKSTDKDVGNLPSAQEDSSATPPTVIGGVNQPTETNETNTEESSSGNESADGAKTIRKSRISRKQRAQSLDEYRGQFLRKREGSDKGVPIFISQELRNRLDQICRLSDIRRMNPSWLAEAILRNHCDEYRDDHSKWFKLQADKP